MVLSSHNKRRLLGKMLRRLEEATVGLTKPMVPRLIEEYGQDPFLILVASLLSLRARDTVTYGISKHLFEYARTPQALLDLQLSKLEKIIYAAGFYRRKAQVLRAVSSDLIHNFRGKVPHTETELLSLPGVGRKTANIVLAEAFGIPALAVDTHVHHLANITGLVHTKTALQTEEALKKISNPKDWIKIHTLFVTWGQHFCTPHGNNPACIPVIPHTSLGIKSPAKNKA
jgi:endonuclease III